MPSVTTDRSRVKLAPLALARVLWPYVAVWLAIATALGAYAWHEIPPTRALERASGRAEADNRALQQQMTQLLADQRRLARNMMGFALLALVALSLPIGLVAVRAVNEASTPGRFAEGGTAVERAQARTDPLTGVANRRAFEDAIARCHDELKQMQHPFVLAFVDVDRFKRLNDSQGHVVGDRALRRIAQTLTGAVRRSDVIARLGGDEFAVLMPNADGRAMHRPFDAMFSALSVAMAGEGWPVGFSIGVIAFETPIAATQDTSDLTDKLMYAVKAAERDGVRYAVYRGGRLHPDVGFGSADQDIVV